MEVEEQKQTQEALRQSKARLKYLLASSPTVIYSAKVSDDYEATFMSENVTAHFGYQAEEFIANSEFWFSHIHPEDQALVLQEVEHLFEKNNHSMEYRFLHKNGEYRWVRDEMKIMRDSQGNPLEIIGSWTDFTELKQAQESQRINEERFRLTLKNAPITVFNQDLNLRYTWIYSSLPGYNIENIFGKTDFELFPPEEAQSLTAMKQEVMGNGKKQRQIVCLEINGKKHYFDNNIEALSNEWGEIIGITGVALDITERYEREAVILELNKTLGEKAAELELAYQEIRNSKEFIENVINAVSDPIFVKDRQGHLQLTNDSLSLLVSNQKQKLLGKTVYDLFPKNEADVFTEKDELVFTTGVVNENEEYLTDTKGKTHFISTKKSRFVDAKGNKFIVGVIRDLTKGREIEEALRRSEARFQRIAANVPGGIYQFALHSDGARSFPYTSDRFLGIFEITSEEIQENSNNIFNKFYPEDIQSLEDSIAASAESLTKWSWEGRLVSSAGKIKWIQGLSQPEKQANGDMIWDGLIVEITERKETERQLLEQLSLSKLRLEITNVLTQEKDLQTSLQKCTQALVKHLDGAVACIWLLNQTENILELKASTGMSAHLIRKIAKRGRGLAKSIHNQEWAKREGIVGFVEYLMLVGSELLGVIAIFARHPLTEIVAAEMEAIANVISLGVERRLQEEALRLSEKRYRQIVETAQEGIWLIDAQAKTTYVNPQMAAMLGYSVEEMLGSSLYNFMDEQGCLEAQQNFARRQQGIGETHDFRFTRQDGSHLWTMLSTSPIYNELGEFAGALAMIADISQRVKMEEALRETNYRLVNMNDELKRVTRLKDEFLANMSHELRTPLNSILGLSEALQEEVYGGLTEKQQKSLITIENSGKYLLELINDILDLAKIEAGKMKLSFTKVRVQQLCEHSVSFIREQAYKKNIHLAANIPELEIAVDERRIRQALINLLSNGIKFTPAGGSVTLEVKENLAEKTLNFNVIDTGIGMAEENLNKLFQPFSQIDSSLSRNYNGTGLGLALVRTIAELHGGKVSVVSSVGVGSKFTISLPKKLLPAQNNFSQQEGQEIAAETTRLTQAKLEECLILIADDNDDNIELFNDYLTAKGYKLMRAKNGLEAIKMAVEVKPQIILMDIQMPEMDGLTAISRIRAIPEIREIPMIALTGLAMTGDREKCLQAGADEYLTKPVSLSQLAIAINKLI
ncbi:MAG: PAS domain S-box protein [Gomphosphaeria aponina SAG 52.96 = DSM 107014]|uniref:Circadian input-output histidine kinase CikA n=1 Tax=Gomphosphaeria aponina SAG 52.96 = DSM 107014 TaxID=1521640 RepID=A0A941GM85_9CHRO|nr:PAS domain S-box protein [Gomphosphaeria aponina SAG 52.96 = DSM 107014]